MPPSTTTSRHPEPTDRCSDWPSRCPTVLLPKPPTSGHSPDRCSPARRQWRRRPRALPPAFRGSGPFSRPRRGARTVARSCPARGAAIARSSRTHSPGAFPGSDRRSTGQRKVPSSPGCALHRARYLRRPRIPATAPAQFRPAVSTADPMTRHQEVPTQKRITSYPDLFATDVQQGVAIGSWR